LKLFSISADKNTSLEKNLKEGYENSKFGYQKKNKRFYQNDMKNRINLRGKVRM